MALNVQLLPASRDWLEKLDAAGAVEVLRGQLFMAAHQIPHPFWCRQICDVLPPALVRDLERYLVPAIDLALGTSPYSEKKEEHLYKTMQFRLDPHCSCQYSYAGAASSKHQLKIRTVTAPQALPY